jgi:hypothetical protein
LCSIIWSIFLFKLFVDSQCLAHHIHHWQLQGLDSVWEEGCIQLHFVVRILGPQKSSDVRDANSMIAFFKCRTQWSHSSYVEATNSPGLSFMI